MGLVTDGAAIPERSLVEDLPRALKLSLSAVAFEADAHGIGTQISGLSRGVRIVAVAAGSLCARMLDLRALDPAGSFSVALDAKRLGIGFGKNHFAVLRRLVADVARSTRIRRMREFLDQLRPVGLVYGVAGQAIRLFKRLSPVGFDKRFAFDIVAADTQRVRICVQMKIGFRIFRRSLFVNDVAGVTPHIEGGMPAPIGRDVQSVVVTSEAKIFLLAA